jgi:hypothetical protein
VTLLKRRRRNNTSAFKEKVNRQARENTGRIWPISLTFIATRSPNGAANFLKGSGSLRLEGEDGGLRARDRREGAACEDRELTRVINFLEGALGWTSAVVDWLGRKVSAWRLSINMDVAFCIEAVEEATNQGPQSPVASQAG